MNLSSAFIEFKAMSNSVTGIANGVTGMKVEGCPMGIAANGVVIAASAMKIENAVTEVGSGGIQIPTKILNLFS